MPTEGPESGWTTPPRFLNLLGVSFQGAFRNVAENRYVDHTQSNDALMHYGLAGLARERRDLIDTILDFIQCQLRVRNLAGQRHPDDTEVLLGRGRYFEYAADTAHRLFNRRADRTFDVRGARAGIRDFDRYMIERKLRVGLAHHPPR